MNKFNEENAEYQIEFQKSLQNAQLSSKDDEQLITKYRAEVDSYAAQVNKEVLSVNKLTAEIQDYTAKMQKVKLDVDLYHQRSSKLQQQYDAAFSLMIPAQAQQEQRRRR